MPLPARLILACLMATAACASTPGIDRPIPVDAEYAAREEARREPDDRCGPEFLEKLLPDMVLSTLAPLLNGPFGPVCQRHDACYRLGEQNQAWCDTRMRTEMIDICKAGREDGSVGGALCRFRAGLYHSMVDSPAGAYAYQGTAGGNITGHRIAEASKGELEICATIGNSTKILQSYALELRIADGKRVSREPRQRARKVRAGETTEMCTGTTGSTYWNLKRLTGPLTLHLMADRPDSLSVVGSYVEIHRAEVDLPAVGSD